MGTVYFAGSYEDKVVKIGFTKKDPEDRIREFKTGCPYSVNLLHHIPGDYKLEQALHKRFQHLRLNGEWFKLDEEVSDFMEYGCTPDQRLDLGVSHFNSVRYDMDMREGYIELPEYFCVDMRRTIKFFELIDYRIRKIFCYAGGHLDTIYYRNGKEWKAQLMVAP